MSFTNTAEPKKEQILARFCETIVDTFRPMRQASLIASSRPTWCGRLPALRSIAPILLQCS